MLARSNAQKMFLWGNKDPCNHKLVCFLSFSFVYYNVLAAYGFFYSILVFSAGSVQITHKITQSSHHSCFLTKAIGINGHHIGGASKACCLAS